MRKLALAIACALFFVAPAAKADQLKLSMEKIAALYTTLTATFGPPPAGAPALKLDAKTAFAIAIDIDRLKPFVDNYNAVVKDKSDVIAKEHPGDVAPAGAANRFKPGSIADKEVMDALTPLWKAVEDIDLMRIRSADLNIGVDPAKNNSISPAVLATMLPIIEQ